MYLCCAAIASRETGSILNQTLLRIVGASLRFSKRCKTMGNELTERGDQGLQTEVQLSLRNVDVTKEDWLIRAWGVVPPLSFRIYLCTQVEDFEHRFPQGDAL